MPMKKTFALTINFADNVSDADALAHANAIVQNSRALGAHIVREENPVKGHGYDIAIEVPAPKDDKTDDPNP